MKHRRASKVEGAASDGRDQSVSRQLIGKSARTNHIAVTAADGAPAGKWPWTGSLQSTQSLRSLLRTRAAEDIQHHGEIAERSRAERYFRAESQRPPWKRYTVLATGLAFVMRGFVSRTQMAFGLTMCSGSESNSLRRQKQKLRCMFTSVFSLTFSTERRDLLHFPQ